MKSGLRNIAILVVTVFSLSFFAADMLKVKSIDAAVESLPSPGKLLNISKNRNLPSLKGLKFNPENPLEFEFIVEADRKKDIEKADKEQLLRYFMAVLTVPQKDLWVNLSPYEEDRVLADSLVETELGRELLAQDYILKQLSSSLTYPKSQLGKDYWALAKETDSFNKVWIVPDEISILENENIICVEEANLKVLSEADYLAISKHEAKAQNKALDLILPTINEQVNNGEHFAKLRQIYSALILGLWFKNKFADSFYRNYFDKSRVAGLDLVDMHVKDQIYDKYTKAFEIGVYDILKSSGAAGESEKRRFFSGGFAFAEAASSMQTYAVEKNEILEIVNSSSAIALVKAKFESLIKPITKISKQKAIVIGTTALIAVGTLLAFAIANKEPVDVRTNYTLINEGPGEFTSFESLIDFKIDEANDKGVTLDIVMNNAELLNMSEDDFRAKVDSLDRYDFMNDLISQGANNDQVERMVYLYNKIKDGADINLILHRDADASLQDELIALTIQNELSLTDGEAAECLVITEPQVGKDLSEKLQDGLDADPEKLNSFATADYAGFIESDNLTTVEAPEEQTETEKSIGNAVTWENTKTRAKRTGIATIASVAVNALVFGLNKIIRKGSNEKVKKATGIAKVAIPILTVGLLAFSLFGPVKNYVSESMEANAMQIERESLLTQQELEATNGESDITISSVEDTLLEQRMAQAEARSRQGIRVEIVPLEPERENVPQEQIVQTETVDGASEADSGQLSGSQIMSIVNGYMERSSPVASADAYSNMLMRSITTKAATFKTNFQDVILGTIDAGDSEIMANRNIVLENIFSNFADDYKDAFVSLYVGLGAKETMFNQEAVSPVGAVGIMQMMPAVYTENLAKVENRGLTAETFPEGYASDTHMNIMTSVEHFTRYLTDYYLIHLMTQENTLNSRNIIYVEQEYKQGRVDRDVYVNLLQTTELSDANKIAVLEKAIAAYNCGINNQRLLRGRVPRNGETNLYVPYVMTVMNMDLGNISQAQAAQVITRWEDERVAWKDYFQQRRLARTNASNSSTSSSSVGGIDLSEMELNIQGRISLSDVPEVNKLSFNGFGLIKVEYIPIKNPQELFLN